MNKPTPTPKQAALAAIGALPDETSFEEIADRLPALEARPGWVTTPPTHLAKVCHPA